MSDRDWTDTGFILLLAFFAYKHFTNDDSAYGFSSSGPSPQQLENREFDRRIVDLSAKVEELEFDNKHLKDCIEDIQANGSQNSTPC